jgi:hypothetical protein
LEAFPKNIIPSDFVFYNHHSFIHLLNSLSKACSVLGLVLEMALCP